MGRNYDPLFRSLRLTYGSVCYTAQKKSNTLRSCHRFALPHGSQNPGVTAQLRQIVASFAFLLPVSPIANTLVLPC
jgi:hypothetical protein